MSPVDRQHILQSIITAGEKLHTFYSEWQDHLAEIKERESLDPKISAHTPPEECLFLCLELVERGNTRINMLARSGGNIPIPPLNLDATLVTNTQPFIGTETKKHRLKRTLARAALFLLGVQEFLQTHEMKIFDAVGKVRILQTKLLEFEQGDFLGSMSRIVKADRKAAGTIPEKIQEIGGEVEMQWKEMVKGAKASIAWFDDSILKLFWMLGLMGIEVPRQRMITEYFSPV